MFATFYFPYISMLTYESIPPGLRKLISEGNLKLAAVDAARQVETCDAGEMLGLVQLRGDLQMTIGMDIDADDSYREAQRLTSPREQVGKRSCRNAGWQALFRSRYGTAMSCFMRLAEEQGSQLQQRIEGLFGVCFVLLAFSRLRDANNVLNALEELINKPTSVLDNLCGWRELISAVRFDVSTQGELRSHAELSDHVYWQSAFGGEKVSNVNAPFLQTPLLKSRRDFLQQLMELANGKRQVDSALGTHADWAGQQGMTNYQRVVRLDIVLASLAARATALGEPVLTLLISEARMLQGHRLLEYLYCLAKLRRQQERNVESLRVYARYALTSMRCIRDEADALAGYAQRNMHAREQLDYIEVRLPVRYRRAYRYLVDHLDQKDLSVQEIANEIGVTLRSLQSVFKQRLGSTPSEIIRRLRMERIRAELQAPYGAQDKSILDAANKWGVSNRSTLISSYRREFNEAPSSTINR